MTGQLKKYIKLHEHSDDPYYAGLCRRLKECISYESGYDDFFFYPGMSIYVSGAVGAEGIKILTGIKEAEITAHLNIDCVLEALSYENKPFEQSSRALFKMNVAERGIMQCLFKLSEISSLGFEINIDRIPILQSTVEISEYLKINPYNLLSHGCRLIISGDKAIEEYSLDLVMSGDKFTLRKIGVINDSKEKVIITDNARSLLNRPHQDELLKYI